MKVLEGEPLAPYTTLRVGGPATVLFDTQTLPELEEAVQEACAQGLPVHVLGGGSNVLVSDAGVPGAVVRVGAGAVAFVADEEGTLLVADAGTRWDTVVDAALHEGLWGVENLAGVPGTVGGAAVQNIGAYGAEFATVFAYADAVRLPTGAHVRIPKEDAAFRYRTSRFKNDRELLITRVALRLFRESTPLLEYPDLKRARAEGISLTTPGEIARAIRSIRSKKFPTPQEGGTAGSFFKNPTLTPREAARVSTEFPGIPVFPQQDGSVRISLAWLLDHALGLKGFAIGGARLFERQPLVVVTRSGATAADVDALAEAVSRRVRDASGIIIEREVESFGVRA